jgi:hypothetical protein
MVLRGIAPKKNKKHSAFPAEGEEPKADDKSRVQPISPLKGYPAEGEEPKADDESLVRGGPCSNGPPKGPLEQWSRVASSRFDNSRDNDPRSDPDDKKCILSGPSGHESPEPTSRTRNLTRKEQGKVSQRDEGNRDCRKSDEKPDPYSAEDEESEANFAKDSDSEANFAVAVSGSNMDTSQASSLKLGRGRNKQKAIGKRLHTSSISDSHTLSNSQDAQLTVPASEKTQIRNTKLIILVPYCNALHCPEDGCMKLFIGKDTATARSVMMHVARYHLQKPDILYTCRFCGFLAPESDCYPIKTVQKHVREHHPNYVLQTADQLPFPCEFPGCGKSYRNKLGLSNHLRSHKEKPGSIKEVAREKCPPRTRDVKKPFQDPNTSKTPPKEESPVVIDSMISRLSRSFRSFITGTLTPTKPNSTKISKEISVKSTPKDKPIESESTVKNIAEDMELKSLEKPESSVKNQLEDNLPSDESQVKSQAEFDGTSPVKNQISDGTITLSQEFATINIPDATLAPDELPATKPTPLDFQKLQDLKGWLDDSIILNYMLETLVKENLKVIILDPLLWDIRNDSGQTRKFVRPEFREDWNLVIIPINQGGNHWVLAVANSTFQIRFYNTLGGVLYPSTENKLINIVKALRNNSSNPEIVRVDPKTYYQQPDSNSCGPAICMLAERLVESMKNGSTPLLKFTIQDTQTWRKNALQMLRQKFPDVPLTPPHPALSNGKSTKKSLIKGVNITEPKPVVKNDKKASNTQLQIQPPRTRVNAKVNAQKDVQKDPRNDKNPPLPVKVYQNIKQELSKPQSWGEFSRTTYKLTAMIKALKEGKDPFDDKNLHFHRMAPKKSVQRDAPKPPDPKSQTTLNMMSLYNRSKKKAISQILENPSPQCKVDPKTVTEYFKEIYKASNCKRFSEFEKVMGRPDRLDKEFIRPITKQEVRRIFQRVKNTSPGEDRISYKELREIDPSFGILTKIFNRCLQEQRIPSHWKRALTILIHKKGDASRMENWRPIALSNTIYKIYTGIWAQRLSFFPELISPEQKGFCRIDGTGEHTFLLRNAIHQATNLKKEVAVAWLDLTNAFGSIPHDAIIQSLQGFSFPDEFVKIVRNLYTDTSTTVRTEGYITEAIPVQSGVKQGDPLSPILFNLAIEPIIRKLKSIFDDPLKLHDVPIQLLAFADDLALLAKSSEELQSMLDTINKLAKNRGLKFNAKKCASLHIAKGQIQHTKFKVDGVEITFLKDQDHYEYLGTELGKNARSRLKDTATKLLDDLKKIGESKLAPWQKIDAIKTFIILQMVYLIRHGDPFLSDLKELDRAIKYEVRSICKLPHLGTPEHYIYGSIEKGGLGILSLEEEYHIQSLNAISRLGSSPNARVRKFFNNYLKAGVKKFLGLVNWQKEPSKENICEFLSGKTTEEFQSFTANMESHSLLTRIRRSARALKHSKRGFKKLEFEYDNDTLLLHVQTADDKNYTLNSSQKHKFYGMLKNLVMKNHIDRLTQYHMAGDSTKAIQLNAASSEFNKMGQGITFSGYHFIHRARLGLHALNAHPQSKKEMNANGKCWKWRKKDPEEIKCRRCGYERETLSHVLCHCLIAHGTDITKRHNAIVERLVNLIPKTKSTEVILNKSTGNGNTTRPDILKIDHAKRRACIIDVTCPFERGEDSLRVAAQRKVQKYSNEASILRKQGYQVYLGGFVVGALGAWYPGNNAALNALGIHKRHHKRLTQTLIGQVIENSKTIFWRHILGDKYRLPKNFYSLEKNTQ